MSQFDYEILQFSTDENSKQYINFKTGCVKKVTFKKVDSNCGIFKQALENRLNEFHRICGSKNVVIEICQKQLKIEQLVTFEGPTMW